MRPVWFAYKAYMPRAGICVALLILFTSTIHAESPLQLWLYCPTNLQVDQNVTQLDQLWRRAAKAGYSHVLLADSKLARLGDLGDSQQQYFKNVKRIRQIADE